VPHKKDIYYSSEKFLFYASQGEAIHQVPVTNKNNIKAIDSNSWAVFCADLDKVLSRVEDHKEVQKMTLPAVAMCIACDEANVYVLTMQNEMMVLNGKDFAVKKQQKLAFNASAMNVCGDHIWVGDKNGVLYVLDASSLSQKAKHENKHTKTITAIASNSKMVASGDAYRYTHVWDNETMEPVFNHAEHKQKIMDVFMDENVLLTVSLDHDYITFDLGEKKQTKEQKLAH